MITAGAVDPTAYPTTSRDRLTDFTELVATAISNTESRVPWLNRLAEEQAALRRVATLVARDASQRSSSPRSPRSSRSSWHGGHPDGALRGRPQHGRGGQLGALTEAVMPSALAFRWEARMRLSLVFRTGQPARIDDYRTVSGRSRERAIGRCSRGRGHARPCRGPAVGRHGRGDRPGTAFAAETESRLGQFTELMATAIANTESRARADRLARGAGRPAAGGDAGRQGGAAGGGVRDGRRGARRTSSARSMRRCSATRATGPRAWSLCLGAGMSAGFPVGTRLPIDGDGVIASVLREGRPRRIDDYGDATGRSPGVRVSRASAPRSAVRSWSVGGYGARWARRARGRGVSPGDRDAHRAVRRSGRHGHRQRRRSRARWSGSPRSRRRCGGSPRSSPKGAPPTTVFDAVAAEMEGLLGADGVGAQPLRGRRGGDRRRPSRGLNAARLPPGTRTSHEGENADLIGATHGATRPDRATTSGATARSAELMRRSRCARERRGADRRRRPALGRRHRELGGRGATAGRQRGADGAVRRAARHRDRQRRQPGPAHRVAGSPAHRRRRRPPPRRARSARRRAATPGAHHHLAEARTAGVAREGPTTRSRSSARRSSTPSRATPSCASWPTASCPPCSRAAACGPASTRSWRGSTCRSTSMLRASGSRREIEASAYFFVAEALTNVVKHAHADHARGHGSCGGRVLRVEVRDDGIGGARPDGGGLLGLADRVAVLHGQLRVESPADGGTLVVGRHPRPRLAPASRSKSASAQRQARLKRSGGVTAGWCAAHAAVLAAELRGVVVAHRVGDASDVVAIGFERARASLRCKRSSVRMGLR